MTADVVSVSMDISSVLNPFRMRSSTSIKDTSTTLSPGHGIDVLLFY